MSKHLAFRYEYHRLVDELLSEVEVISRDGKSGVYKGVWDTGAMTTMITPRVFTELNLIPVDTALVSGVNSQSEIKPVVLIDIILPNSVRINQVRAAVSDISGVDMLIGIDIIQLGDFSISTLNRETVFTFAIPPFPNRTDLYEKAEKVNGRKK
jgi:hypothetical protein